MTSGGHATLIPKTLLLLLLLTIALGLGVLIHKRHWRYLPETTATIMVGIVAGLIFQVCFVKEALCRQLGHYPAPVGLFHGRSAAPNHV